MSKIYQTPTTTNITTTAIAGSALAALAQVFIIEDAAAVSVFLDRYPALVGLLLDARDAIDRYFPDSTSTPSILRVAADPEIIGHHDLVLAIQPQVDPEEAFTRFMAFMDGWWLDAQERADNRLVITTEYQ